MSGEIEIRLTVISIKYLSFNNDELKKKYNIPETCMITGVKNGMCRNCKNFVMFLSVDDTSYFCCSCGYYIDNEYIYVNKKEKPNAKQKRKYNELRRKYK
jgi:hypothetical protein